MLNFRSIKLEDKEILEEFLKNSGEVSCENTFVNLFVWQGAYNNKIAIDGETLFIKYGSGKTENYRLPIGGDLEEGLKKVIDSCGDKMPVFWSPINENFSRLPRWFSEKYDILPTRDSFDYIYLREDLANLSGKKYHSKRNHISAFSKKFDWRYEAITPENIGAVMLCAEEWYDANADRLDKYALCECDGVKTVLQNMESLNVSGGAIFVENRAVAFTLGTPINNKVFDIFAEKALPDFAEGYTAINREFAKTLTDYKYLNREDDMGLEGLRKAKLSYKPAVILEKYLFKPKTKEADIYRNAFGQETEFENSLFSLCGEYIKTLKVEGETVSMLFALPCLLIKGETKTQAIYIFAAATDENHRKKGYMERLLNSVLKETEKTVILCPASKELENYYKKFGFVSFKGNDISGEAQLLPLDGFHELTLSCDKTSESEINLMCFNAPFSLENLYFPYTMP